MEAESVDGLHEARQDGHINAAVHGEQPVLANLTENDKFPKEMIF